MLNFLRPAVARVLDPVGQALARTPVTPNMVTVAGTVGLSACALTLFPMGETFPGAISCAVFVCTDMLDGTLARIKGTTSVWGQFLDSTMDRVADAAIFGGLTIWFMREHDLIMAIVTLFCLSAGFCVSYVKARAEGVGLSANVGLVERPERMLVALTAVGLSGLGVPYIMQIGLWALAVGSLYTLWQRLRAVWLDAKSKMNIEPASDPVDVGAHEKG
jgi:CDP-diacylglycerol--glycerol-3-phosphate 3-phosphatidyltransferase